MTAKTKAKAKTSSPRKRSAKQQTEAPSVLHVGFVWDMSGSMMSMWEATVEGTRGYLHDLRKEEEKLAREHGEDKVFTYLTVTAFDTVCETWVSNVPARDLDLKALDQYQPRGGTALYDAIAQTVTTMATRAREDEKVLVVVMTDGQENSSVEYALNDDGQSRINKLVKSYEGRGNWTFVYLGANVDAWQEAAALGIPTGNSVYYSSTGTSVNNVNAALGNVTSTLRGSSGSNSANAFADAGESQDYRDGEGT